MCQNSRLGNHFCYVCDLLGDPTLFQASIITTSKLELLAMELYLKNITCKCRSTSYIQWAKKWKNSTIRNCCINVRGAIKLQPLGTSAKRSKVYGQRGAILLPLMYLSSNCIISTLFYCLTIEQFLIQVPSEVRHTY